MCDKLSTPNETSSDLYLHSAKTQPAKEGEINN